MIISNKRIRIAIDTSSMGTQNDVLTSATPMWWNGTDIQFELGLFFGSQLLAVSNLDSITVDLKAGDPRTGLPLMSATIPSSALNQTLTLDAWNGGAAADCHALVPFTNEQTNLALSDDTDSFWLVISALTADTPSHKIVLGAFLVNVTEGGEGVSPPAAVTTDQFFNQAQSDARYTRTVDLTAINTNISTLQGQMTAVTTTANAALPKAGGTLAALTLTGTSGVLKSTAGVVAGSATTSDLPEGSNVYWTQARFNAAIAAIAGAVSGICPLDSSSLIPASYLPSITVHNTYVVASQAAMLALTAHQGDVAIRTDINQSFILTNNAPATLANWAELLTPASAVTSVNGASGTVVLTSTNIAEGTNLYYTTARAQADALTTMLTGLNTSGGGAIAATDTILGAFGKVEYRLALDDAKVTGADRVLRVGDTMTGPLAFSGATNAGVILSSLTDTQKTALAATPGMLIYNNTYAQLYFYNGAWQPVGGAGTNWYYGATAPASTVGGNGSFYLNTATGVVYFQSAGAWAAIYTPSGGTITTAGGTFTGQVNFPANIFTTFGNGWQVKATSGTDFYLQNGATVGANWHLNTGGTLDTNIPNGALTVSGTISGGALIIGGEAVINANAEVSPTHLYGSQPLGVAPSIASVGSAAGSGGSVSIQPGASDVAMGVQINVGTTPPSSGIVAIINLGGTYATLPKLAWSCTSQPGGLVNLAGLYIGCSTTQITISTVSALTASKNFVLNFILVG